MKPNDPGVALQCAFAPFLCFGRCHICRIPTYFLLNSSFLLVISCLSQVLFGYGVKFYSDDVTTVGGQGPKNWFPTLLEDWVNSAQTFSRSRMQSHKTLRATIDLFSSCSCNHFCCSALSHADSQSSESWLCFFKSLLKGGPLPEITMRLVSFL